MGLKHDCPGVRIPQSRTKEGYLSVAEKVSGKDKMGEKKLKNVSDVTAAAAAAGSLNEMEKDAKLIAQEV